MRKFICLFVYLFIIQLFLSCEKDLYEESIQNSSRDLKITRKPFKDLLLLPSFNKAYGKLQQEKQKSALMRSALEDEYNFTIDEERQVNIVEKDSTTTYNILIRRDSVSPLFFENLIFVVKEVNEIEEISAVIFKYATAATIEQFSLENNEGEFLFGKYTTCIRACAPICYTPFSDGSGGNGHIAGHLCQGTIDHYDCSFVCFDSGGGGGDSGGPPTGNGGGGTTSGGGNTGGGGGGTPPPNPQEPEPNNDHGGGSDDDEIVVLPVLELEDEEEIMNPCDELQNLLKPNDSIFVNEYETLDTIKRPKLKAVLTNLRQYLYSTKEHGYELNWKKAGDIYTSNFVEGSNDAFTVELSKDGLIYGTIHTHPIGSVNIPSFGDLVALRNSLKDGGLLPHNKEKFVMMVVVINPNGPIPLTLTYALKIEDLSVLDNYVNSVLNSYGSLSYKEKMDKILEAEGEYYKSPAANFENLFLNKYGSIGFGLYKADENLTTWNKLSSNGTVVTDTPCN